MNLTNKITAIRSSDRVLRVFDTSKGGFDCVRRIPARDVGWSILDTAFSPDGRAIIYSSWSEASKSASNM